jgi:hypothetical protein
MVRIMTMNANNCPNFHCKLGPCMCNRVVTHSSDKNVIKPGVDDHMWKTKSAGEIIASTYTFIKYLREEIEFGKELRRRKLKDDGQTIPAELLPTPWTKADDDFWLRRK